MRSIVYVLLLMLLWLFAWGDFSIWNMIGGAALATVLLIAFPPRPRTEVVVRAAGLVRLVGYLLVQLVTSNVLVSREIVTPGSNVRTGVLAYRVDEPSEELLALMANVIALTPGTMTVEATYDPPVLYVHFLLLEDVDAARRSLRRLEVRCRAALDGTSRRGPATAASEELT